MPSFYRIYLHQYERCYFDIDTFLSQRQLLLHPHRFHWYYNDDDDDNTTDDD
jgi:hypothetical protein